MQTDIFETIRFCLSLYPDHTEAWAAVIGAILGAIIGGIITYFLQRKANNERKKEFQHEQQLKNQSLGRALIFKVSHIYSDIRLIYHHLQETFEHANSQGQATNPWTSYQSIAALPDPINFTADEMGMLLGTKNDDLFNELISLDRVRNTLIESVKVANTIKTSLGNNLPNTRASGQIVTHEFGEEELHKFLPHMIQLNTLLIQLRQQTENDVNISGKVLKKLVEELNSKLDLNLGINVSNPD